MFSTDSYPHAGSPASSAKKFQSPRCPRAQIIPSMADPPPTALPIDKVMDRPLRWGFGKVPKPQSRSLPKFVGHRLGSLRLGPSSSPPASMSKTLASAFSANRRATTEPDEP